MKADCAVKSKGGSAAVMLLVVLLFVGILMQQTVRSLWVLRRGQDYQLKVQQANQLLELGRSLDSTEPSVVVDSMLPLIVQVGSTYAKLEYREPTAENGDKGRWIATLPVDVKGVELPSQVPVVVSCERKKR